LAATSVDGEPSLLGGAVGDKDREDVDSNRSDRLRDTILLEARDEADFEEKVEVEMNEGAKYR
jgi:hypothetical protein